MQSSQNTFNERKEHYKKRLFAACKKLFARPYRGFEDTTILEVTQATRTPQGPAISDTTINKYFGKKPSLLALVFEEGWAAINDPVKEATKGVDGAVNKL